MLDATNYEAGIMAILILKKKTVIHNSRSISNLCQL